MIVVRGKVFYEVVAYAAGAAAGDEDIFLKWGHDDGTDQQFGLLRVENIIKSVFDSYFYMYKIILKTFQ